MTWKTIAKFDDIGDDEALAFEHNGSKLALFKSADVLHVTDNVCTHQYALLSEGYIEDGCVECPLHQGSFDLATGAAKCAPATQPIRVYPVRMQGTDVQADLP
ncbi:Anthranilate 1,2-dioxygenase ferredoxin subunit [compost metagenome]